ncbi:hypothetical protein TCAL_01018 [Tigriopus californicus]|uniref:Heparan sulfate 2-O-sulfotransferase pipe n=1 Tax=Tigriopus californicus TaxID=6832 RepID=A0A553P1X9_TIGCA|nr:heparan sulfate 2-O-sulfotransferase pipe-like [Tigriopus californicus]TRY71697.1 hypothetical protein TCAL_01018 [Tigriopus californicus]|eukprot:TCALIF_01018-PA protein Name:"Similar to pip Heparan sulfate 2-O-sulfotransferase pipe (Drosophila melanogaster)" AED:0.06 eAED:0.06 QI:120/1/1/1/1/1/3/209/353
MKKPQIKREASKTGAGNPHTTTITNIISALAIGLCAKLYWDHQILNTELSFLRQSLNVTPHAHKDVLFFNRVPKVGSQTVMGLLKTLSIDNNFAHYVDDAQIKQLAGEKTILPIQDQHNYARMFMENFTEPSVYNKHISFIDFETLGSEYYRPIYMNFVREPVQRVISWYYYIRAPWYQFESDDKGNYKRMKPMFAGKAFPLKLSYDECVLGQYQECRYIPGHNHVAYREGGAHVSQMMFFCGHEPRCQITNGEEALRIAKANVDSHFAVVGILEEMDKSMTVLEHFLPRFFKGVKTVYNKNKQYWGNVNKNKFRPEVSNHVRNLVRQNMTREVEFYEYCKQRLHKQYLSLGL